MPTEMSDELFQGPEWEEYAQHAREKLWPMITGSAIGSTIIDGGAPDPKMALELGYMLLADVPLVVATLPGVPLPDHLARCADATVELDLNDPGVSADRFQEAVARIGPLIEARMHRMQGEA